MPIAALSQIYLFWVYLILFIKSETEDLIFSVGNSSPIVPVHANRTSSTSTFFGFSSSAICFSVNFLERSVEIFFKASKPCFPVNALAFLELINIALIFLFFILLFHFIFSETIFDWVYTLA